MTDDPRKIARVAAGMAISNLGHLGLNVKVEDVTYYRTRGWSSDATYEICQIAGHLIESDYHEQYFTEEAEHWERQVGQTGLAKFRDQFPHHAEWIQQIMDTEL